MNSVFLVLVLLVVYLVYCSYKIKKAYNLARNTYAKNAKLGSPSKPRINLLVVGDSIGTGVGASSFEASVAGRVASYLSKNNYVNLVNKSINGNKVGDLAEKQYNGKWDIAIAFISSNDVVGFTPLNEFSSSAGKLFEKFSKIAKKFIIIGPANVSLAHMLPFPLRLVYHYRGPKYVKALQEISLGFGNAIYINSLNPPKRLGKYKSSYHSTDKFHPNDKGHKFWFEMVKPYL